MISRSDDEYVDMQELAQMLGVQYATIRQQRYRGRLPKPDRVFGRSPVWRMGTLRQWAREAGKTLDE